MLDILMSTYNGERFLRPQMDSILTQSTSGIRLLVRDDGSTDHTLGIITEYAASDPRVVVIDNAGENLGAFASFMKLVESSTADYFMFADQDDVWLTDKVSRMYSRMVAIESGSGPAIPTVLFSDLSIVDENLNVIDRSLWHYQQFDPNISRDWRSLLAQNVVLGCAMMANAAARRAALPFLVPEMPHDQWVAVVAARLGRIEFIREPTVLYRQHEDNHSGANIFRLRYALSRTPGLLSTIGTYRKAVKVFPEVTTAGLTCRKILLNLRRFRVRDDL